MKVLLAIALISAPIAVRAADPTATPAPPKEKKLCRVEATTGSIFSRRICHSKAEWTSIDAQNQQDTAHFHDRQRADAPGS